MRVLFVCNSAAIAYKFRLPIIQALQRRHSSVSVATFRGFDSENYIALLQDLDIEVIVLSGSDCGITPLDLLISVRKIRKLLIEREIDIVHSFTHLGNATAFLSSLHYKRVRLIATMTGAGRLFVNMKASSFLARTVINVLYKLIARRASYVSFQNPDDATQFSEDCNIPQTKIHLTAGSGFDDSVIKDVGLPNSLPDGASVHRGLKVFTPSRLLREKGLAELASAAKALQAKGPNFQFFVAGQEVLDKRGWTGEQLIDLSGGQLNYLGFRDDILELILWSDLVVLPSYYREGIPRALIEALAMGKPVITCDTPGCREVVVNGRNGYVIAPRDCSAIISALEIISNKDLVEMGLQSRKLFEEKFRADLVVSAYFECYDNMMKEGGKSG